MAAAATNENIKKVLLEIAGEEKTHVGEFQTLLLKEDKEQVEELEKGRKEVEGIMKLGKSRKRYKLEITFYF
ncbi:MAG: hypothetical protein QXQ50_02910 [Candidatus Bathyarchaeia archaeon]